MKRIKVNDKQTAWTIAELIFPTDYELDRKWSERCGHSIHVSAAEGFDGYTIDDMDDRLLICRGSDETVRIDIEDDANLAAANKRIAELEASQRGPTASETSLGERVREAEEALSIAEQRAEAAEAEIFRLKAKLYDCIVEGKC